MLLAIILECTWGMLNMCAPQAGLQIRTACIVADALDGRLLHQLIQCCLHPGLVVAQETRFLDKAAQRAPNAAFRGRVQMPTSWPPPNDRPWAIEGKVPRLWS